MLFLNIIDIPAEVLRRGLVLMCARGILTYALNASSHALTEEQLSQPMLYSRETEVVQ